LAAAGLAALGASAPARAEPIPQVYFCEDVDGAPFELDFAPAQWMVTIHHGGETREERLTLLVPFRVFGSWDGQWNPAGYRMLIKEARWETRRFAQDAKSRNWEARRLGDFSPTAQCYLKEPNPNGG
jgi:hypothetical protein